MIAEWSWIVWLALPLGWTIAGVAGALRRKGRLSARQEGAFALFGLSCIFLAAAFDFYVAGSNVSALAMLAGWIALMAFWIQTHRRMSH